jgi:hypothetical protein
MVCFAKLGKLLYFSRNVEQHQTNSAKVSREHVERRTPSRSKKQVSMLERLRRAVRRRWFRFQRGR